MKNKKKRLLKKMKRNVIRRVPVIRKMIKATHKLGRHSRTKRRSARRERRRTRLQKITKVKESKLTTNLRKTKDLIDSNIT